jgi:hypothetical protein
MQPCAFTFGGSGTMFLTSLRPVQKRDRLQQEKIQRRQTRRDEMLGVKKTAGIQKKGAKRDVARRYVEDMDTA